MGNGLENYFFMNDTKDSLARLSTINSMNIKFPVSEYDECALIINGEKFIYFDRNRILYLRDHKICGVLAVTDYLKQVFNDMSHIISKRDSNDIRTSIKNNEFPTLTIGEDHNKIDVVAIEVFIMQ